jgi:hypothetical protein
MKASRSKSWCRSASGGRSLHRFHRFHPFSIGVRLPLADQKVVEN